MTLYEISNNYTEFMEAAENGMIPEEAISDTLEAIEGEFIEKADNIACLIKNLEYEAEDIKAEAKSLTDRAKAKEKRADQLRAYLSSFMPRMGYGSKVLETPRNKLSWRKSEAVVCDDQFIGWAEAHCPDCLTYKQPEPNKTAIKMILKGGAQLEHVEIVTRQNLQIK